KKKDISTSQNQKLASEPKNGSSATQERDLMIQMGDAYMKEQNTPEAIKSREDKKNRQANRQIANEAYDYAITNYDQSKSEQRYNEEVNQNTFWQNTKKGLRQFHNTWIGEPSNTIAKLFGS